MKLAVETRKNTKVKSAACGSHIAAIGHVPQACRTLRLDAGQMTVNVITFACSFNVWPITSSQAEVS